MLIDTTQIEVLLETKAPVAPRQNGGRIAFTPRAAVGAMPPDRRMHDPELSFTFTIRKSHGPALRSAVEEISDELGSRLEGPHSFPKESSLTNAVIAIGHLRRAVNAKVDKGDPFYA